MTRTEKAVKAIEDSIKNKRPFIFIAEPVDGAITITGSADKDWIIRILKAVLAGAESDPNDDLTASDKLVTVEDMPIAKQ